VYFWFTVRFLYGVGRYAQLIFYRGNANPKNSQRNKLLLNNGYLTLLNFPDTNLPEFHPFNYRSSDYFLAREIGAELVSGWHLAMNFFLANPEFTAGASGVGRCGHGLVNLFVRSIMR
jgi:hypothetical protein